MQQLLARPLAQWRYTVEWQDSTTGLFKADDLIDMVAEAEAIDRIRRDDRRVAEARRNAEVNNALKRGQRSAPARSNIGSTRIVAANYGSLISAITPAAFRRFLPEQAAFEERTHVLSSCTTDTPLGTIHHSGSGLIFDLNKRSVETQTDPPPDPPPLTWASLDGDYLDDRPALVQEMFGFRCFSAAESFFTATWPDIDLDEPGFAYPSRLTMFDEYLLSLWRMRTRMAERVIGSFAGLPSPQQAASKVVRRWIPRLGQAGRALIWAPSTHYLERSCPPSF